MQYVLAFLLGYLLVTALAPLAGKPPMCLDRSEPYRIEKDVVVQSGNPELGLPQVTEKQLFVVSDCIAWDK
jgi:hypothetical protein